MIRAAAVAAALVVAAFFALGIYQATSYDRAKARLDTDRNDARAATLLDRADTLNPDADVDIARARLAFARGDAAGARRILLGVVGREPENARAWGTIELVFAPSDPALARRAARAFDRLVPTVPGP